MIRIGLLVNPIAGMGGSVGLKGTDGAERLAEARARGAHPAAGARAAEFLRAILSHEESPQISWITGGGDLGETVLKPAGCEYDVVYTGTAITSAVDSVGLARAMLEARIDLLVFVGGDGTARNIQSVVGDRVAVLGVPAGVKMHSGVFAINPQTAARVVGELLTGQIVSSALREVRDFDEARSASRTGIAVRAFGELRVPEAGAWVQQTKIGGKESEPLAVEEIVADLKSQSLFERPLVIGAGSTCQAFKNTLTHGGTLRGVDVRHPDGRWQFDVMESQLLDITDSRLIVSFSRQQGFLFGRGNQVLSQRYLRNLTWPDDVLIVGTRSKLLSLDGRPLLVDTGDTTLDNKLTGFVEIISGFEDRLLYRVARDYADTGRA